MFYRCPELRNINEGHHGTYSSFRILIRDGMRQKMINMENITFTRISKKRTDKNTEKMLLCMRKALSVLYRRET